MNSYHHLVHKQSSYRLSPQIQFKIKRSLEKRHSLRPITIKWINNHGFECKKIVKQNNCFCSHSYAHHQYHYTMQPYCKVQNCGCKCFEYIPHFDIKCLCKHSLKDHNKQTKKCRFCTKCTSFLSSWACKCGFKFHQHKTQIQEEWDKQLKMLPQLQKKYFIANNSGQMKKSNFLIQPDFIEQSERLRRKQQEPNLSGSQYFQKKRLQEANQRILKISTNEKDKSRTQDIQSTPNVSGIIFGKKRSIEQMDYSGTPLQLILTPHRYRFTNSSNFLISQKQKSNKIV